MLVIYTIKTVFYIANQIGIFVLLSLINGNDDESKKGAMKIYRSLLTLYAFVGFSKIFGFFWLVSLSWKLKNVGNEVGGEHSSEEMELNQIDSYQMNRSQKTCKMFLYLGNIRNNISK
jgi:hypothetical protein